MKKNKFYLLLFTITLLLFSCSDSDNDGSFEEEYMFTNLRIWESMWDALGNAIEYREWDNGNFIQTGKLVYETNIFGGQERTELTNTYLLIPDAPPTCKVRGDIYIIPVDGVPVLIGKIAYLTFEAPPHGKRTVAAIKTTYTKDKWVGIVNSEVFAGENEDNMKQIGYVKYHEIESGSGKVINTIMTKGLGVDDLWFGEIGDTTYCLSSGNPPKAIKHLMYKNIFVDDSTKAPVLMLQDIVKENDWKGIWNGNIHTIKK